MSLRNVMWILLLLVVAGIGLRSYQLTARSLWFDEAFSWRLVQFPFQEMIARAAADVHPPLYYIFLRGWGEVFGTSLLSLRSFSVVLAGATVAAAYLFASYAWGSRRVGLMAAALIAFSGWQVAFAWEARMYTLGTLLALLSSWALLKAIRQQPQQLWWWMAYAVLGAAFAYTHYFAFFTLAAHAAFVTGLLIVQTRWRLGELFQSRLLWFSVVAALVMVLLYLPWIPTFIAQNTQVQEGWWPPPIGGWAIPDTFYRMMAPTAGIPWHEGWLQIITLLPITFTAIMWLWLILSCKTQQTSSVRLGSYGGSSTVPQQKPCDASWLVVLCGAMPFLLSIGISFVGQSLYQDRFLVFAHLFIAIGFAALIMKIPHAWLRRSLVALVLIGSLVVFGAYWRELDIPSKPGARAATQMIFAERQADEPIFVTSAFVFFAVDHYAQEEFGGEAVPRLYSESTEFLHFAGGPILTQEDHVGPQDLQRIRQGTIWVVDTTGFGSSEAVLPDSWQRIERRAFPEVFGYQGEVIVSKYER